MPEISLEFFTKRQVQWYLEVYPHLAPHERPIEVVQQAGEVVYIPSGWWHQVSCVWFCLNFSQGTDWATNSRS